MTTLALASYQLLRDLGKTYTLKKAATSAYNTSTGQAAVTNTTSTFTGKMVEYRNNDIDGTTIQRGDRRLLVAAASLTGGVVPDTQDSITGDGNEVNIINVQKIEEGGSVVIYVCQVRA